MKIKTINSTYEKVLKLKKPKHKKPGRPWLLFKLLIRILSWWELRKTHFKYKVLNKIDKGPHLILMNHSSFLDLKMASKIFKKIPYNIVSTTDGLVGKEWLMRSIGCIPTQKFVHDLTLINDIKYAFSKKRSVLMFPEAGYSFDGTATPIPQGFARLIKYLNVPVIFVKSYGAFHYDPLYNGLQIRKVDTSADVKQILSKDDVKNMTNSEIDAILNECFTFDNFKWQQDNKISIAEPFRADGLERILYKCPHCKTEGKLKGKGTLIRCENCNKEYELTEFGYLKATSGETEFSHIPDWFNWEREEVKNEILNGTYSLDTSVEIGMIVDYKALYMIGKGRLVHNDNGFTLTSDDGAVNYSQPATTSYTLNSDYFWYEIGDVISIGDKNALYYCFVKDGVSVTKARLATEEIYKIKKTK